MAIVKTLIPAGGGDYTLMSVAESTDQQALAEPYILECYAGSITDSVSWAGWTTSAANNISVKAAAGNHLDFEIYSTAYPIRVEQRFISFTGLRVTGEGQNGSVIGFGVAAGEWAIDSCILTQTATISAVRSVVSQNQQGGTGLSYITNTLIIATNRPYPALNMWSLLEISNCTVVATGAQASGIVVGSRATSTIKNTVIYGVTGECFVGTGWNAASTNNASGDATAPGSNPQTGILDADFVDYANGDYSPAPSPGKLAETGADLSGDFTTDIAGATRTVPWTIGAYIVAGGPPPVGVKEMYIKDGGIFVKYTPYVNVGGTFQEVDAYVLDGGTWKPVHEK